LRCFERQPGEINIDGIVVLIIIAKWFPELLFVFAFVLIFVFVFIVIVKNIIVVGAHVVGTNIHTLLSVILIEDRMWIVFSQEMLDCYAWLQQVAVVTCA
jgi:hypothetical protein